MDTKIINYDSQGWPIYKMSLKDIIATFMNYNPVDKAYWIKEDDPKLQLYPRTLEDDGMGYGINEKNITSFDFVKGEFLNVFIEQPLEEKEVALWQESKFYPGCWAKSEGTSHYLIKNIFIKDNEIYLVCDKYKLKNGEYKFNKTVTKIESELNFIKS